MKNQMQKIAAAALLVCGCAYVSAQVAPPAPMPPAPAGAPGILAPALPGSMPLQPNPGGPLVAPQQSLQTLTTVSGKITAYQTNDRYAYCSFTMQGNSGAVTVRFAEQLDQQLMNNAKKGESITVKVYSSTGPDGITAFQLVSATAGKVQITDTPPSPPLQPVLPEQKTYSGTLREFRRDQQGMINGLELGDKMVVDLSGPATAQLQSLLKTGDKLEVSGFKDMRPDGIVLTANAPVVIHPQTITLNGRTYLIR